MPYKPYLPLFILFFGVSLFFSTQTSAQTDTSSRFTRLVNFAHLANAAYQEQSAIQQRVSEQGFTLTEYDRAATYEVNYYLATNDALKTQVIAIRGTANVENAIVDLAIELLPDKRTGINLHHGFAQSADAIFEQLKDKLNKNYAISTTGHSLGGAVAVILAMYLDTEGFSVDRVVTFGQPKVTNISGGQKFSGLNLTRVVTPKDAVPLVPPVDPLDLKNISIYWHFGNELILLDGNQYAVTSGLDSMLRAVGFFTEAPGEHNLQHHQMSLYLKLLEQKLQNPQQVEWKNNFNFNFFGFGSSP